MIQVEVYGKRDCCLCDEVKATLSKVRLEIPFDLYEIDVECKPEIYEAYKERIPLVLINGRPAFRTEATQISVGKGPAQVRFTPDGRPAFVSLSQENAVAILDDLARAISNVGAQVRMTPVADTRKEPSGR